MLFASPILSVYFFVKYLKKNLNEVLRHVDKFNLFHNNQFGFTKSRSFIDGGIDLLKSNKAWKNSQDAFGSQIYLNF